ncbi:motility associated factor glycosyltransferase family protein [Alkalicoccobacillus murimartini]|uniref:DUF115 domain-containing protein n=1 Tax=Alkalicoccobacillus murimartini TaxID=171685 RepID=A0ABT9YGW8_9BACI|nr:6-hydroxymethylpterin diphosphokinase MptE-like protein [Alkalicoccobacillus murimartini]MDQ0206936.1 hypothetical protein [Alkalicoccobacillus murimartini]
MLIENRNYLRIKNRVLLNKLNKTIDNHEFVIQLAKNGVPTLAVHQNEVKQFLHSSYNPTKEVDALLTKYQNVLDEGDPILFLGIGLGHHIQAFIETYKPQRFSLIELNPAILKKSLELINLTDHTFKNLTNVYLADDDARYQEVLDDELQNISPAKLVILPSYERIYKDKVNKFSEMFKKLLLNQKDRLHTNVSFQSRWVLNSLRNLPSILKTPNFIHDIDTGLFKDKPAIIVAAGPSLNDEIEQLKKIKENQSAYIFSVGSAINALIEQGIHPDAAFTYDPKEKNQYVFEKLKKQNLKDIPMIFGSSVGYETLHDYPGKMLHFLTSQDTVSEALLEKNNTKQIEAITDAPSIAVIALQVLSKIGCNPIVLVGQNLSYSNVRYAAGIEYGWLDNQLSEDELAETFEVESVDGGVVRTKTHMVKMREALEHYAKVNSHIKLYNTTKNGAKINYTEFISLESLSNTFESEKIDKSWLEINSITYDQKEVYKNYVHLMEEQESIEIQLNKLSNLLEDFILTASTAKQNEKKLDLLLSTINKYIHKIEDSSFYKVFLGPMSRHELEILSTRIREAMYSKDVVKKSHTIIQQYKYIIQTWNAINQIISEHVKEVEDKLIEQN